MEDQEDGSENVVDGKSAKRSSKVRDIFTDRIVGIVSGAAIPVVLLFIPLINKYLDNSKEIQALQIQSNAKELDVTNQRLAILSQALVESQAQLQTLTVKLTSSSADFKKVTDALAECQRNCDCKKNKGA